MADPFIRVDLELFFRLPHRLEQSEVRRWYGWMLLTRGEEGDRERARTLLGEARALYKDMGMPAHVEMSKALLASASWSRIGIPVSWSFDSWRWDLY